MFKNEIAEMPSLMIEKKEPLIVACFFSIIPIGILARLIKNLKKAESEFELAD